MDNRYSVIAILIAILALVLASTAIVLNREPGPQGLIGPQGIHGINGTNGINGINGTDAPINKLPTVRLVTQSGDFIRIFPAILNNCRYTYNIVVCAGDSDDSNIRVSFYYRTNPSASWKQGDIYYGDNGEYNSTVVYPFENIIPSKLTNYWLVEVWDGSDIVTGMYSYTITP